MKGKAFRPGWYQAYVSLFDQTVGLRDSGLRVIVQIMGIQRMKGISKRKREKMAEGGLDYIEDYQLWWTNANHYLHYGERVLIIPPGEKGNVGINEFACIQKQSPFGWDELVLFDAGYEIGVDEAKRRLDKPHRATHELITEVRKTIPDELKFRRRPVYFGQKVDKPYELTFTSFDEAFGRKRVIRRATTPELQAVVRGLYRTLPDES